MTSSYWLSVIAIVGTLLGALVAGLFGQFNLKRQLRWQREDANMRYRLETERWAHSLLEERDRLLWQERRQLYARVLSGADAWVQAIKDIRDTDLTSDVQVSNRLDVENTSQVAWIGLKCGDEFGVLVREMRIIGHLEVAQQTARLEIDLIRANRDSLTGQPDLDLVGKAITWLADQMRVRLTREGKPRPPQPWDMAEKPGDSVVKPDNEHENKNSL
jgi:hypothetical protein